MNAGPRTVFFALDHGIPLNCALDQVVDMLQTETSQTIIKIDEENEEDHLIHAIESSHLKDRVSNMVGNLISLLA